MKQSKEWLDRIKATYTHKKFIGTMSNMEVLKELLKSFLLPDSNFALVETEPYSRHHKPTYHVYFNGPSTENDLIVYLMTNRHLWK